MPRNKTKKRINKKSQMANNILATVQKMEKDLMNAPFDLSAQLDKEINAHIKKENKLGNALDKAEKQVKTAEKRVTAAEAKTSTAAKKQLKVAMKKYKQATIDEASLAKQLQAVTNTLTTLLDKQDKFDALGKFVSQFDKEWTKSVKKEKAKTQTKKTKAKAKTESDTAEPFLQAVEMDDDSGLEEITELAS